MMMLFFKMIHMLLYNSFLFSSSSFNKILLFTLNMILIMFIMNFISKSSWFLMMFMILMLGGLMILFIYFSALNKNNKIYFTKKYMTMFIVIFMFMHKDTHYMTMNNILENFHLNYFISSNSNLFIFFLIFYMLILLIINLELISNINNSMRAFS